MALRCGLPLIVLLGLSACSAELPTGGANGATETIAAAAVPAPAPAVPPSKQKLRCKTVLGEVEGFGRESVRSTAEQSRLKAIAAETEHRKVIGQTIASIDLEETECVAVYPIGAEEWHCMARARVCAQPAL